MNKESKSLSEVHESVNPSQVKGKWKRILAFLGPAYLVSVGYMDPGNWATDIAGGSRYGYTLLWVLLMSNLMALLLQSLTARLGIVRGRDLAQCNRESYPRAMNFILYILAELAIAACDLAEVLGMAIGLYLLLDIPLLWGVLITFLDTLLLLYLQRLGIRKLEAFIISLVAVIGGCFLIEIWMASPDPAEVVKGLAPSIPDSTALYIAIGIIGATVMPHNLYLHSALVQTRKIKKDPTSIRQAIKLNTVDSAIALNAAFLVNAAILVLAASVFYTSGNYEVATLGDAHKLLEPLLGSTWASHLFAIALIAAGQSSTITGTLAGQIVMEGYLKLRINPVVRRLLTRLLAIVPAVLVIVIMGEKMIDDLLVFSQVLLSMQLAFAIIPLIHFVSDKEKMGAFAIGPKTKITAWTIACIISVLNLKLVYDTGLEWMALANNGWITILIISGGIGILCLLGLTVFYPLRKKRKSESSHIHIQPDLSQKSLSPVGTQMFAIIALALDYSENDFIVISHALEMAKEGTEFILIHVVESASARVMGAETEDYETRKDRARLDKYVSVFTEKGYACQAILGYGNSVREITRILQHTQATMLITGSHGHKGFYDFLHGSTINRLRHLVHIPVYIAK